MKKNFSTIILISVLVIGLSLLLYPSFSDWYNSMHQTRAIANYSQMTVNIDDTRYREMLDDARAFNNDLASQPFALVYQPEMKARYDSLLNVTNGSIMSYVDIPSIRVQLPIYHGTNENVLQIAIGHMEGTSLPVGGESTHCVISGHRGLPSARLFTDIDQLVVGDEFKINTLDEILTYEVDQIKIVLPYELENLHIVPGEDLCTLVTCTPYGINSHRLLVRGHRVDTVINNHRVTADARQIEPTIVAPVVALPMLLFLLVLLFVSTGKNKRKRG